ncbi:alpha-1,2-mannosyltransferase [Kitasatospora sp. MAP12-15]|uniref:glycosyltransferase family 87 protein n=1 Tax=unclassified Kitasatospora TaxID=2633591 RepID=UPI002475F450|nr:glycosyltransferase family 87 protein [Kitasatospora sp. MAP12-44]MDH6113913.1 alpha-1,2-mannosyltransferase [Kitasatospora sp. MAP12-44]
MVTYRQLLLKLTVLSALAAAAGIFLAVIPGHRGWFDVGVYYGTVQHWIHGGRLYDYQRPGTGYGFTYPPFAALCMLPMALVGWHTAIAVATVLSVAASAALLYWLVDPIARRQGWDRWFAFGLAACAFAILNPVRDTFSFGQINLLLMALVFADYRQLADRKGRFAGIGTGLAAALKLTPVLFIGYLLIAGRRRAALVAAGTALGATLLGQLLAPQASRFFWTDALWNTSRIGRLDYVSNQSLQGMLARLAPTAPSRGPWLAAVLLALAVWAYRSRTAARRGDQATGFALTGLASCLVSPIAWVHHLVWTLPALLALADAGLRAPSRRRRQLLLTGAGAGYLVLTSGLVWLWHQPTSGLGDFLGANAYLLLTVALLLVLPLPLPAPPGDRGSRPLPCRCEAQLQGSPDLCCQYARAGSASVASPASWSASS